MLDTGIITDTLDQDRENLAGIVALACHGATSPGHVAVALHNASGAEVSKEREDGHNPLDIESGGIDSRFRVFEALASAVCKGCAA